MMISSMNAPPTCVGKRKLIYIPIIHTAADMGTLGASIRGKKLSTLGRQGLARNAAVLEKMWEEIERVAARLPLAQGTMRLYQDGLPVCGHERAIVSELAGAGSRNHRLLLELEARGATLMGTESPELLVQEYQLATAAFASEAAVRTDTLIGVAGYTLDNYQWTTAASPRQATAQTQKDIYRRRNTH